MKKLGLMLFTSVMAIATVLGLTVGTANSRPQYAKAFVAKFVKKDSTDPNEKAFAEAASNAKCLVCHEGDSKKNRNAFGKDFLKTLQAGDDTAKNVKDTKKIDEALDAVMKVHVDAKDPKSPTYGDLVKEGKLPVENKETK